MASTTTTRMRRSAALLAEAEATAAAAPPRATAAAAAPDANALTQQQQAATTTMTRTDRRLPLLALLACAQLLLAPAYRSTDFEVHRNWLAVTHSLPLSQWYLDATSPWTLDYPPLFAWFERLLSFPAALADAEMLRVAALDYASPATVLYQRLTVSVTGLVLAAAAWRAADMRGGGGGARGLRGQLVFFSVAASAGLLLVDNVHFQYNGVLLGVLVWSLLLAEEGRFIASGALFAVLLNMKHLFAYAAPAYFVFLLRAYVLDGGGGGKGSSKGSSSSRSSSRSRKVAAGGGGSGEGAKTAQAPWLAAFIRLAALGAAVVAVFAASLGPFAALGQLPQLAARLFPFGRGLVHAYWAPNAWALYAAADKAAAAALARAGLINKPPPGHLVGGRVGVAEFAALPTPGPHASAAAVLLALAPCLVALWRQSSSSSSSGGGDASSSRRGAAMHQQRRGALRGARALAPAVAYAHLCGFVWGYHVHEKAVLTVTVPLALLAADAPAWGADFFVLSAAGTAGLFPLILGAAEAPVKWLIAATYLGIVYAGLEQLYGGSGSSSTSGSSSSASTSGWLPRWARLYVAGLVPLELYCGLAHAALLGRGGRLPFLPLLLTSVYCAAGVVGVWLRLCAWYVNGCPP